MNGNDSRSDYCFDNSLRALIMIICICNNISEADVAQAVAMGAASMGDLRMIGVGKGCGRCASFARSMLEAAPGSPSVKKFVAISIERPR